MAARCRSQLEKHGYPVQMQVVDDATAIQKGAALLVWVETETGCLLGRSRSGKRGRSSESIAEFAVKLLEDLQTQDVADQLILFAAPRVRRNI